MRTQIISVIPLNIISISFYWPSSEMSFYHLYFHMRNVVKLKTNVCVVRHQNRRRNIGAEWRHIVYHFCSDYFLITYSGFTPHFRDSFHFNRNDGLASIRVFFFLRQQQQHSPTIKRRSSRVNEDKMQKKNDKYCH